jgi:hypothetical protein
VLKSVAPPFNTGTTFQLKGGAACTTFQLKGGAALHHLST